MTDETATTASAYFHIGNGGITFSVQRRPKGEFGNGPHLCVMAEAHGTQMTGVDVQTTPESLRALGLELLEAAAEDYPRPSGSALTTTGSMPLYNPWKWARYFHVKGHERLGRMRAGERVEEVEHAMLEQEKRYYEKAERLQRRVRMLKAEAERLEAELSEHQLHTPKMWKRRDGGEWVDPEPRDLAEFLMVMDEVRVFRMEPDSTQRAVDGLTKLFHLVQSDDPWKMKIESIYAGGWPPGKWDEFEGLVRHRAAEKGWAVGARLVPAYRRHRETKHLLLVQSGVGLIEIEEYVG